MMDRGAEFRERLLAAQGPDEQLKSKHQEEIRAMLEYRLNRPQRWVVMLLILAMLLLAVVAVNVSRWSTQSSLAQEIIVFLLVFGAAAAGWMIWVVACGAVRVGAHGFSLSVLVGVFSIFAAAIFGRVLPDLPRENLVEVIALMVVTVVIGWVPLAVVTVSYYHHRTREKLLEIQYQLAELAEEVRRRK